MKKPTQAQIKSEAEKLRKMKPTVLHKSMFGDNHHDAIEAQIEVLSENLDEDAIYGKAADMNDEAQLEDDSLWRENVINAALEARHWMDGEEKISPTKNWESLVRK